MKNRNAATAFTKANAIVGKMTLEDVLREIDGLRRRVENQLERVNDTANLLECQDALHQASNDMVVAALNIADAARSINPVKKAM